MSLRAFLLLAPLAAALAGCGHHADPDPGGLTPEDSQLLNNAAEMLDMNSQDNAAAPTG